MLDKVLRERGKHIISGNGSYQLTIIWLWFSACWRVLYKVGMLDKFLREWGKHIISVMVRTN